MNCRICDNPSVSDFIDFGFQPLVHGYKKTPSIFEERFEHQIGLCSYCGFLQLTKLPPSNLLYEEYFTLSSWKKVPHLERLIWLLKIIKGDNCNQKILEIGCNDGSLLIELRNVGFDRLYGIEPTRDGYDLAQKNNLNVIKGFFPECLLDKNEIYDVVICRHVLEHILDLDDFVSGVYEHLRDDGVFVIEVPDSRINVDSFDYCIWEEHCNFFTINSLNNLLRKNGFSIIHHESILFSGCALLLFCEKSNKAKIDERTVNEYNRNKSYIQNWDSFKKKTNDFFRSIKKKIYMYGCGARSQLFINLFDLHGVFSCFIDDQKEKQGLFAPGSNLEIVPSTNFSDLKKCYVSLGVNFEYEQKIIKKNDLQENSFCSILPPSCHLPDFWKSFILSPDMSSK